MSYTMFCKVLSTDFELIGRCHDFEDGGYGMVCVCVVLSWYVA
jgi:hypothetical protein